MRAFDKITFAKILSLAKGDRSINQFGIACHVDPGYLSRLLRGLLNNPPSPAILAKIAAQAANGVTYQELMQAAGILRANEENDTGMEDVSPMRGLLSEINAFFRMQPDLTDAEKETLIQDMRDYFQYKAAQTRKKK
jgi:transcriptional regulator with XRE-family HTH domain